MVFCIDYGFLHRLWFSALIMVFCIDYGFMYRLWFSGYHMYVSRMLGYAKQTVIVHLRVKNSSENHLCLQ